MTPEQRKLVLFEICNTKEELKDHMKLFFDISLPDDMIDEDSTSNPMEFVWQIYNMMRTNSGNTVHVAACSRNSAKTLTSALLHTYAMIHFRRTCLQLAAIIEQSASCIAYVDKFLGIADLLPYSNRDNAKTKSLNNLPANSFTKKPDSILRVATATKKGTNSQRANFICIDECDLTPQEILDEVSFVADPTMDSKGYDPIFVYLSSRKTSDGPIQHLIDDSVDPEKEITLHKWSAVDWMRKCTPDVHKPEEPHVQALINLDSLEVEWEPPPERLTTSIEGQFKMVDAFAGCRTCKAFVVCQARAPRQKSTSKMLRSIKYTADRLRNVRDPQVIIAQLLNMKPETTGVVFKTFSEARHVKDPIDFYKYITGEYYNPQELPEEELMDLMENGTKPQIDEITPTKSQIYLAMQDNEWTITYGVDWGYYPAEATCIVTGFHRKTGRGAILHVEYSQKYPNPDWAKYIMAHIMTRFPPDLLAPDLEDPAAPIYFSKAGVSCMDKKPARIETGVSQIRSMMYDPTDQAIKFCILYEPGDEGVKKYIEALSQWTHAKTNMGYDFERYADDHYCDYIDPTRYAFAPYIKDTKTSFIAAQPKPAEEILKNNYAGKNLTDPKVGEEIGVQQIKTYFQDEHGLSNVFSKEERLRALKEMEEFNRAKDKPKPDEPPPEPPKQRKSTLKYRF